ncbi:AAA family ATPase [Trichococcus shcherbakoviae]|uniref:Atpase aaa-type core n=1 Tax=Trichococcus shcherbakoviae TaxID=2094020 RepID=A0A383TD91_9LACT|nr:AAA family ATPase [Trichococcus shcherbakoviae]SYZ78300.1 Hypothetical protein TART1_1084 [Trichococcus shcherbakoviae]
MFLSKLDIYDFRQFCKSESGTPGISVLFNEKFNILVGENDSGKSTIIDAIRYLFGTLSDDFDRLNDDDFHNNFNNISDRIELVGEFRNLSDEENGAFLEWLSFDSSGKSFLRVSLIGEKKINQTGKEYIDRKIKAGDTQFEIPLSSEARSLLKTTYLKPLRDAKQELQPGYKSRLAQILKSHPALQVKEGEDHPLVELILEANKSVENFFSEEYITDHSITKDLEQVLQNFLDTHDSEKSKLDFKISSTNLLSILRRLSIESHATNMGLGNQNLLFIATEFLLLNDYVNPENTIGPNIVLVEEIEAHIHTQAQIRLIKFLEEQLKLHDNGQFILTTHSNEIAASVNPENLILVNNKTAFPFSSEYSSMNIEDLEFLKRFFDFTKSNALFAKGLILVEGDSENLLLPALAEFIDLPLHKYGVSIINVRGTSFERYIKMFSRNEKWINEMGRNLIEIPISIVTDLDVKPIIYYTDEELTPYYYSINHSDLENGMLGKLSEINGQNNEVIITDNVGIEYSTTKKLCNDMNIKFESEQHIELIAQLVRKDYTAEHIESQKISKKRKELLKYSPYNANLKVEIAPEWTLEFSIALSCLKALLFESVHETRYTKPFDGNKKIVYDEMKAFIENADTLNSNQMIAYQIFKPVNEKLVSKAEVAQKLGGKLINIEGTYKEELKNEILSDTYLQYLINAIKHSCGVTEED